MHKAGFLTTRLILFLSSHLGPCVDAPTLANVCGKDDPVIQDGTGLYILVEFTTDVSVTYRGWEISYHMGQYLYQCRHITWVSIYISVGKQSPCLLSFVYTSSLGTVFEHHQSSENTHRNFHIMKTKCMYRPSYAA